MAAKSAGVTATTVQFANKWSNFNVYFGSESVWLVRNYNKLIEKSLCVCVSEKEKK